MLVPSRRREYAGSSMRWEDSEGIKVNDKRTRLKEENAAGRDSTRSAALAVLVQTRHRRPGSFSSSVSLT